MATVARILQLAPVVQMLAGAQVSKGRLFGKPKIDPNLSIKIFCIYKILKRVYDEDPNYTGVRVVADYLYEIFSGLQFKAAAIVDGNNGGQIAPPTSGSGMPNALDFIVSATTIIPTDGTTLLLDGTSGNPDWRGYTIIMSRGSQTQHTTPQDGGAAYYSWNSTTGLLSLLPVPGGESLLGEPFHIQPIGLGGGASSIPDSDVRIIE